MPVDSLALALALPLLPEHWQLRLPREPAWSDTLRLPSIQGKRGLHVHAPPPGAPEFRSRTWFEFSRRIIQARAIRWCANSWERIYGTGGPGIS